MSSFACIVPQYFVFFQNVVRIWINDTKVSNENQLLLAWNQRKGKG